MCKAWEDSRKTAEKQGMQLGVKQGVKQGVEQGESRLGDLIGKLLEDGRMEDAMSAARDKGSRKRLYREYGIV